MNLMDYGNSLIAYRAQTHWFLEKNQQSGYPKTDNNSQKCHHQPYKGIGKPEPLKYELSGKWSRRIDKENRFVYAVENNKLIIYSLKGHC